MFLALITDTHTHRVIILDLQEPKWHYCLGYVSVHWSKRVIDILQGKHWRWARETLGWLTFCCLIKQRWPNPNYMETKVQYDISWKEYVTEREEKQQEEENKEEEKQMKRRRGRWSSSTSASWALRWRGDFRDWSIRESLNMLISSLLVRTFLLAYLKSSLCWI